MSEATKAGPGDRSPASGPGKAAGSSDQAIGRPSAWREGRYEQSGKPVDKSVITPGGAAAASRDEISTPVTRKDYEGNNHEHEPAGNDATPGKDGERHR